MISIRRFFAFFIAGCVIGCACLMAAQEAQEGRLLRFPDIYKDKIAFMYGAISGWRQAREARPAASLRILSNFIVA